MEGFDLNFMPRTSSYLGLQLQIGAQRWIGYAAEGCLRHWTVSPAEAVGATAVVSAVAAGVESARKR